MSPNNGFVSNVAPEFRIQFKSDVPDTFVAVAIDIYGYSTTESYVKLGQSFNPAIAVRINQQGLDDSLQTPVEDCTEVPVSVPFAQ